MQFNATQLSEHVSMQQRINDCKRSMLSSAAQCHVKPFKSIISIRTMLEFFISSLISLLNLDFFLSFFTWFIFILPSSPYSCPSQNKNNENLSIYYRLLFANEMVSECVRLAFDMFVFVFGCCTNINRQQNYASWRARFEIEIQTKSTSPTLSSRTVQNMQWILFTRSLIIDVCVLCKWLCVRAFFLYLFLFLFNYRIIIWK